TPRDPVRFARERDAHFRAFSRHTSCVAACPRTEQHRLSAVRVKGKFPLHELSSMNTWSDTTLVAWFVARTKPNKEDYAERTLRLRRVDAFLPRIVEVGPDAVSRPAPLFPGYLFVHLDLFADWQRVIWAPGIRDFVSLGGAPIPIDDAV